MADQPMTVEEVRERLWAALGPCLDMDFDLSDNQRINAAIDVLIADVREEAFAEVRRAVEDAPCKSWLYREDILAGLAALQNKATDSHTSQNQPIASEGAK